MTNVIKSVTPGQWMITPMGVRPGRYMGKVPGGGGGGSFAFEQASVEGLLFLHGNGQSEYGLSFLSLVGGGLLDQVG